MSVREVRLLQKAAKVVGEKPAPFARDILKRMSRQVLQRAGVAVRLDIDDFASGDLQSQDDEV
jgi:hypothetical protein